MDAITALALGEVQRELLFLGIALVGLVRILVNRQPMTLIGQILVVQLDARGRRQEALGQSVGQVVLTGFRQGHDAPVGQQGVVGDALHARIELRRAVEHEPRELLVGLGQQILKAPLGGEQALDLQVALRFEQRGDHAVGQHHVAHTVAQLLHVLLALEFRAGRQYDVGVVHRR